MKRLNRGNVSIIALHDKIGFKIGKYSMLLFG